MVTSKPSSTNCPKLSQSRDLLFSLLQSLLSIHVIVSCLRAANIKIFRCLYRRCPPLPIPNREVKPARADGTAVTCGRVGRCQPLFKSKSPVVNTIGLCCFSHELILEVNQAGDICFMLPPSALSSVNPNSCFRCYLSYIKL